MKNQTTYFEQFRKKLASQVDFSDLQWDALREIASVQTIKKDQYFFKADEPTNQFAFVLDGLLRIEIPMYRKDALIYFACPERNWIVCDPETIKGKRVSSLNAIAEEESILLVFEMEKILSLCTIHVGICYLFLDILLEAYDRAFKRIYLNRGKSGFERMKDLMREQPAWLAKSSPRHQAEYCGLTLKYYNANIARATKEVQMEKLFRPRPPERNPVRISHPFVEFLKYKKRLRRVDLKYYQSIIEEFSQKFLEGDYQFAVAVLLG